MSDNLILISQHADDVEFARAVAETNGFTLAQIHTPGEARKLLEKNPDTFVFLDAAEKDVCEKYELALENTNPNFIHFLCSSRLENSRFILRSPIFGSYIQRNFGDPRQAGLHFGRVIGAYSRGAKAKDSPVATFELRQSVEKREAVDKIQAAANALLTSARMASIVANAADEIIMNAIFDAPTAGDGKQALENLPRHQNIPVDPSVHFEMRDEGDYIALTAVDRFGSLDKSRLLNRLSTVYRDDQYYIDPDKSGAGIGLAAIYRSGGSFLFSSRSKVQTEVTVFFRKSRSVREFKTQFRFISIQFHPGNA